VPGQQPMMPDEMDTILGELDGQLQRLRTAVEHNASGAARPHLAALRALLDRLEAQMLARQPRPPRDCPGCGQNWWRYRHDPPRWECSICGRVVSNSG
jgi:hypothetical protein